MLQLIDHAKQCATDALKTASKRAIHSKNSIFDFTGTGDLIDNKVADKITKVSKNSQQDNSETNEEEILRKTFKT